MTVVFWAFQSVTAGTLPSVSCPSDYPEGSETDGRPGSAATSSTFLIMGAYLLADSVRSSALGEKSPISCCALSPPTAP
jgi:hypothetical protein